MIRTFESEPPADNLVAWQLEVQEGEDWRVICAGPLSRSITGSVPDDAKVFRVQWGVKGGGPLLTGETIILDAKEAAPAARSVTLLVSVQPDRPSVGSAFKIAAKAFEGGNRAEDLTLEIHGLPSPGYMAPSVDGRYEAVRVLDEPGRYTAEVRCENPVARASVTFDVLP